VPCSAYRLPLFERARRRALRRVALTSAAILFVGAEARVTAATTDLEQEAARLSEAMRADPADLDLAFRYAQVAILLEDYEGAIGALERMLVLDPNLPRVRLELGSLYFRLEAYEVARVYLEEAVTGPDVPETVETRVTELLAAIDRRVSRHAFAGSLLVGGRFQTNANAGPGSSRIDLGGIEIVLDDQATRNSDFSAFALVGVNYAYDLDTQAGDTLEVNGTGYAAFYADQTQLDLGVVEVDVGPRFQLGYRGLDGVSVRPYALATVVSLDRSIYSTSLGGGLNLAIRPSERFAVDLFYDLRRDDFVSSNDQPTANDRDATFQSGRAVMRYVFGPRLLAEAAFLVADNDASAGFRSFTDLGASAALVASFGSPVAADAPPWFLSVGGGVRRTDYDEPDALLSPGVTRRDDEWRVGATLTANLDERLAVVTRVDYRDVQSNVDLYAFDDLAISVGLLWRF
jgi:hypothetical protein